MKTRRFDIARARRIIPGLSVALAALALPAFGLQCDGPPRPDAMPGAESLEEPVRSLAEIEADLQSSEWNVRSDAVLELMRGEYASAAPQLLKLYQNDSHPAVRQTAALALGEFQYAPAGPLIARDLAARAPKAAAAASGSENSPSGNDAVKNGMAPEFLIDALVRLGDVQHAGAITPFLASASEQLALTAGDALARLEARGQADAVLVLARNNSDPGRDRIFAMCLGKLEARQAEGWLLELARSRLKSGDAGPSLAAAYLALGRIASRRAVPLLADAVAADFAKGRENAVQALIAIGDPAANDRMFELFLHKEGVVRYAAAEVVAGVPDPRAAPRALRLLEEYAGYAGVENPGPGIRGKAQGLRVVVGPAAFVLGRRKHEPAREPIEALLREPESPAREELAKSLGWIGNRASVPLLIDVLKEDEGSGRYGAAWALGAIGDARARPALEAASRSSDRQLALLSVEALGALNDPAAADHLYDIIRSRRGLAFQAVDSLGSLPGDRARQILIELAGTDDLELRIAAIRNLGRRDEAREESIAALIEILDSEPGAEVSAATMAALRELSGESFRNSGQWLHWARAR